MDRIVKILLGIFGFATFGIFLVWLLLVLSGESETAQQVKDMPSTVEELRQNATEQAAGEIVGAIIEVDKERREAVAKEEDPYMKMLINSVYLYVIVYLIIAFLAAFGLIKIKK